MSFPFVIFPVFFSFSNTSIFLNKTIIKSHGYDVKMKNNKTQKYKFGKQGNKL
jgi:hypothetical protein